MFKLLNSIWCAFYQENIKYFHCSLVKPQITFDKNLQDVPFERLMKDHLPRLTRSNSLNLSPHPLNTARGNLGQTLSPEGISFCK